MTKNSKKKSNLSLPERAVRKGLGMLGYDLLRLPAQRNEVAYSSIHPIATYSPWNIDREFVEAYSKIKDCTLVDLYRCHELWTLVAESAKLSSGSIIEIGTWRGGSGAILAKKAKLCGITEPVFLCDTFKGVVKTGDHDGVYVGGEHADTSRAAVEDLLHNQLKLDNIRILEGMFPDDTGKQVENERFRLCHIDVDVYQGARDIVNWIDARMVPGGIYVFDDYGFASTAGVTKFVEEQKKLRDRIVLHNLNGHAVVIRIA